MNVERGYDDALRQWMGNGDDEHNKNTQSIEVENYGIKRTTKGMTRLLEWYSWVWKLGIVDVMTSQ